MPSDLHLTVPRAVVFRFATRSKITLSGCGGGGFRAGRCDRDGIAQFAKFVDGPLRPCKHRALSDDFRIRAAVSDSVVKHFPYDPYLIMRDGPSGLLGP